MMKFESRHRRMLLVVVLILTGFSGSSLFFSLLERNRPVSDISAVEDDPPTDSSLPINFFPDMGPMERYLPDVDRPMSVFRYTSEARFAELVRLAVKVREERGFDIPAELVDVDMIRRLRSDVLMREPDKAYLEELLLEFKPHVFVEYGSGHSTKYYSLFVHQYFSIEHEKKWCAKIRRELTAHGFLEGDDSRVKYQCAPAMGPKRFKNFRDSKYSDFKPYITAIHELGLREGQVDFLLIDGRARVQCGFEMWKYLRENSTIIMHDYFRNNRLGRYMFMNELYEPILDDPGRPRLVHHGRWKGRRDEITPLDILEPSWWDWREGDDRRSWKERSHDSSN